MVVSASKDRSDAFTVFVKRLIHEMPILQHLRPDPARGCRDSMILFDVGPAEISQSPSVKSVGIKGQMTGSRATRIIADDVETPKNSLTQVQREQLAELVKEFDAILVPGGTIAYLGTPQCEMSIYNVLQTRGYKAKVWPARYPRLDDLVQYNNCLADVVLQPLLEGKVNELDPVDPQRFSHDDLLTREVSYGRSGFALQFMLNTSLSDEERFPLKLRDLVFMDLSSEVGPTKVVWGSAEAQILRDVQNVGLMGDRIYGPMFHANEWAPYRGSIMAIDPSGRGGDETGWAVVKELHGRLFLVGAGGFDGGYSEETLTKLALKAAEHKTHTIVIESNFGDGMFAELFKPILWKHHKCGVEEARHYTQKERRIIDTLEPIMNQHRLVVNKRLLEDDSKVNPEYQLFYQMTRLTAEKGALAHDDRLDALAIAVKFWTEALGRDMDEAMEKHREEELHRMLREFEEGVLGSSGTRTTYRLF